MTVRVCDRLLWYMVQFLCTLCNRKVYKGWEGRKEAGFPRMSRLGAQISGSDHLALT